MSNGIKVAANVNSGTYSLVVAGANFRDYATKPEAELGAEAVRSFCVWLSAVSNRSGSDIIDFPGNWNPASHGDAAAVKAIRELGDRLIA
jgi:hypothetical protein